MQKWLLSMCIAILLFTSCSKSVPDTLSKKAVDSTFIKFSMPAQNVSFSNFSTQSPDSLFAIYYNGISDSSLTGGAKLYALAIVGYRSKDSSEVALIIEGFSAITAAKYNFIDASSISSTNGLAEPKFFGLAYTISNRLAYGFINSIQTTGYTEITKLDLENAAIEGSFSQNNCAEYDGGNNILSQGFNMTNGTFKTKMIIVDQSEYDKKYKGITINSITPKLSAFVNKF